MSYQGLQCTSHLWLVLPKWHDVIDINDQGDTWDNQGVQIPLYYFMIEGRALTFFSSEENYK